MNADPLEAHDLAKQNPDLIADLVRPYAEHSKPNRVVPVPEGYNPREQVVKQRERGGSHQKPGTPGSLEPGWACSTECYLSVVPELSLFFPCSFNSRLSPRFPLPDRV
jgi:hypothetical protein